MTPYQTLPSPPKDLSEGNILARLVDGIGFRYRVATEGFTQKEIDFCPIEGSMNMMELMDHIYKLVAWTGTAFQLDFTKKSSFSGFEDYRIETLSLCQEFSQYLKTLTAADLNKVSIYLKRVDTHYPFWYLINGPFADILTHIGQINTWRRISGNPVPKISSFTGEPY